MEYCVSKEVAGEFGPVVDRVRGALGAEGFGVLSEIDVRSTMKKKLDVEFAPYLILGACNPPFAYRALQAEPHIGTMLPCNVTVRELGAGRVEVTAIDPVASMMAVENSELGAIASEIRAKLRAVIASL